MKLGWTASQFEIDNVAIGVGEERTLRINRTWSFGAFAPLSGIAQTLTGDLTNLSTLPYDGLALINSSAATVGLTIQMSPRIKFRGNAWNTAASKTVDFFIENLPISAATPTGTLKFGYSMDGGAITYPLTLGSDGTLSTLSTGIIAFTSRSRAKSTADKLLQLVDAANATGEEINLGTPTLGTCTAGVLVSGSHNNAGQYTSNTSASCIINFGTPNWTNTPFCWAMSTASTTHPRISAASTSSITVTGGVSGETINFFCKGRIGT